MGPHWYLGAVLNPGCFWRGEPGTTIFFLDSLINTRSKNKASRALWTSYLLALPCAAKMPFVGGATQALLKFADVKVCGVTMAPQSVLRFKPH